MLDRRSSGPSDQLFDPDELRVLDAWFAGSSGDELGSVMDGWGIETPHPAFRRIDVAVATILHEWVQLRHPRLGASVELERLATGEAVFTYGDPVPDSITTIVPLCRPLFAVAWPRSDATIATETMHWAVPVPGANKIVLSISLDISAAPDCSAVAIGWIPTESSDLDAVGWVIARVWSRWHNEFGQPRWTHVSEQGLVSDSEIIDGWADLVWPKVAHN